MPGSNFIEPVKLRYKALKDRNQSIYLDCYVNGIRDFDKAAKDKNRKPKPHSEQKTGKSITIPLSDNTMKLLPEREGNLPESRIFYKLPDQTNIRTTQIHSKIIDESKRKAVNLIPKL